MLPSLPHPFVARKRTHLEAESPHRSLELLCVNQAIVVRVKQREGLLQLLELLGVELLWEAFVRG